MHGGVVEARSAGEGLGSEFVVHLPIIISEPEAATPVQATAEERILVRSILVVDDNEDSAASLAMLLQITGHETYVAHDGTAALEAMEKRQLFDVPNLRCGSNCGIQAVWPARLSRPD